MAEEIYGRRSTPEAIKRRAKLAASARRYAREHDRSVPSREEKSQAHARKAAKYIEEQRVVAGKFRIGDRVKVDVKDLSTDSPGFAYHPGTVVSNLSEEDRYTVKVHGKLGDFDITTHRINVERDDQPRGPDGRWI